LHSQVIVLFVRTDLSNYFGYIQMDGTTICFLVLLQQVFFKLTN
jgi:hypothetical protein